uniref:CRACD-like protein n=1 Tax=Semicossyphus pulcher TaxID=241346 RepID=UPI0037E84E09
MASFSGDAEGSTEDIPGRKKSKLKSLKTRLFGRGKRASGKKNAKLSQSESDIAAEKGLGSEENLVCPQGMMPSRALSHESIFLDDQVLAEAEPARVSSQENVGRIKALQIKLQQQKMHLGPPPLVLPRRPEDVEGRSEEDNLSGSPAEISNISPQSSSTLSPIPKSSPTKYALPTIQPVPLTVPPNSSADESPSDFSSPAQLTPRLDTSAARHRMSVKPRKQRAGSKKKTGDGDSGSHLDSLNNIDHPDSDSEKEQEASAREEVTLETEQVEPVSPITSQVLPSKVPEVAPITSAIETKSTTIMSSQQPQVVPEVPSSVPSQVLRVKTHRTVDAMTNERPHSSFIPSEVKDKREGGFEIDVMSHDKRNALNKAEVAGSVQQQGQGETESTTGIKRPTQGSGSFHFSVTTAKIGDKERPRSGSFAGVLEKSEARHRFEKNPLLGMKQKEELRDLQVKVARLRQEEAPPKSSDLLWERRESLKKVESVTKATTDAGSVEEKEVKESVEAQEVGEEDAKTAFGVKLRSTSQPMKFRSDASSNQNSKAPVCKEQCDKQKGPEMSDTSGNKTGKLSTDNARTLSTCGELRQTELTPSGLSSPVKKTPPSADNPCIMSTAVQTTAKLETSNFIPKETVPAPPQEPEPAPQTTSSEVSWMSLAMEKTKSLQQLFNRFPRDFTGGQAAPRPQAQEQTKSQTEAPTGAQIQTQTVKMQQETTPSTDAVKASHTQAVKPSLVAVQQKTSTASPVKSNISREPQALKQTSQPQSHPNTTPSVKTNPPATQSPLHSAPKTQTSSQFAQGAPQSLAQSYLSSGQQQPAWSNRGLQSTNQPVPATSAPTSASTTSPAAAPPPVPASVTGDREATVQEKEAAPLSVSERAAFLEKRAERISPPATKGVELKKAQTEAQTSGESPATAKTTPLSKDTKTEGRQWVKPAESSPAKIPDQPREDKWLRKNAPSSPSRSMSPTMPSTLQSLSDSGQPSWMELAKRKSMAWSDKSMD